MNTLFASDIRVKSEITSCHSYSLCQTTYRRPAVASPREDRRTRRRARAGRCAMGPMCPSAPWRHCVQARAARAPRRVPATPVRPRSARGSPSPVRNRGGASRRSRVITVRAPANAPAATRNPQRRASRLKPQPGHGPNMGRQRAGAH